MQVDARSLFHGCNNLIRPTTTIVGLLFAFVLLDVGILPLESMEASAIVRDDQHVLAGHGKQGPRVKDHKPKTQPVDNTATPYKPVPTCITQKRKKNTCERKVIFPDETAKIHIWLGTASLCAIV